MEDLAYRRMLDAYYLRESGLPLCAIEVGRIISMRDHISDVEQVLNEFFERTEEGWVHRRAEAEIAHFRDKREKASNAGKASAKRRFNGRSTDVQPTNNHKPITNNQDKEPKGSSASEDAPLGPNEVLDGWNELAGSLGLARVRKLTDVRRRKVIAQAKRFPIEDWQAVFGKIAASPFLRGDNQQGWRCDFDFILSENNFVKILEGKYDRQ